MENKIRHHILKDSVAIVLVSVAPTGQFSSVVEKTAAHLGIHAQPGFLQTGSPSVGEAIQRCVGDGKAKTVVVVPLLAGASLSQQRNLAYIVSAAQERFSHQASISITDALGSHAGVLNALKQLVGVAAPVETEQTALLVVGRGSDIPARNAELYQLGRLLFEAGRYLSFETAFSQGARPDIPTGVQRCMQAGAQRVVIVPHVFYDGQAYRQISQQVAQIRLAHPQMELLLAGPSDAHEGIVTAVAQRYTETLDPLCNFCPFDHAPASHSHEAILSILPPRYQGNITVSAAPMSAADLFYNEQGAVAWDQMWSGFCDLALAGGPPHRGTLLEPPTPEDVRADPEAYQRVLAEISRGIGLVTSLPVVLSQSPGWIGVQCQSAEMALWLLRAILVENVSVRREADVLYLPVGPGFRLAYEIKNVITALAKTNHYWLEHLNAPAE